MLPPMLLHLRVAPHGEGGFGIWLPLFLVWLILLPVMVLVALVTAIVDGALFLSGQRYHYYTLLLFSCLGLLAAVKGTEVRIRSEEAFVDICFA
jgi:hypothetical protein